MSKRAHSVLAALVFAAAISFVPARTVSSQTAAAISISAEEKAVIERISEDSLKGNLSFIASDLLEGRATPSRGLDFAAEYIAAQFRRAGIEPAGDDGYFQTANWKLSEPVLDDFEFKIINGPAASDAIVLKPSQLTYFGDDRLMIDNVPIFKVDASKLEAEKPAEADVAGKVIVLDAIGPTLQSAVSALMPLKAKAILVIDRTSSGGRGAGAVRLIDPANPRPQPASSNSPLRIHDPRLGAWFDALPLGATTAKLNVRGAGRRDSDVKLRNVIGILRGSDPALKDSYVLVTAHYDHIGMRPELEGDKIFNGANDDGSGTVSVIELANAFARSKPKRSIVFMTFFGEERGLLGSRYYGRNPVFPLKKTVADINLEQVGRSDSTEGSQVNRASITGYDFSDLGPIFKRAGEAVGIEVYKHERNSDAFFGRSDNQAMADAGVPAHTLCVAFEYSDYHGRGDHWDKIDYPNLARTTRMVALALMAIANSSDTPKWNAENPKTAKYVEAWKKLQESN